MSIEIEVSHNFSQIGLAIEGLADGIVRPSTRRALNRAMITTRKVAINEVKKHLKLKTGTLRKRHIFGNKTQGSTIKSMFSSVKLSGNPIPLIAFLTPAQRKIKDQKGIKVKNRKAIRVSISPGKKIKLRHAFVAKVKTRQVFKRSGVGQSPLKKQGITSVASVVTSPKRRIMPKLTSTARSRFKEVFDQEIQARLNKSFSRKPRMRRA